MLTNGYTTILQYHDGDGSAVPMIMIVILMKMVVMMIKDDSLKILILKLYNVILS